MSGNPSSDQPPFQRKKLKRGLTQEQIDSLGPLTFGFDIGIASVGWAVLSETRIVDLGVRCFDAAEDPKTGESLGERWRTQKVARRRLHRRKKLLPQLVFSGHRGKLFLDSLTQVHNRAALDERLELEYKRWLRYNTPLCLAIIDIDHFKQIGRAHV